VYRDQLGRSLTSRAPPARTMLYYTSYLWFDEIDFEPQKFGQAMTGEDFGNSPGWETIIIMLSDGRVVTESFVPRNNTFRSEFQTVGR
jgi:hypothetical protein